MIRHLGFLLLLLAPLTVAALFRVWVHQDTIELGYGLDAAEKQREDLTQEIRALHIALAAERSPSRLSRVAATLGLHPPTPRELFAAPAPDGSGVFTARAEKR